MQLRWYQAEVEQNIAIAWARGARAVLAVLPTGAGKTVLFSEIIKKHQGYSIAVAHRQELVSQISLALARDGVYHDLIAPSAVKSWVATLHRQELSRSFYKPGSAAIVAGVDTLIARAASLGRLFSQVTLVVQDEAHHVLRRNKWGAAAAMFPHAKMLGVTATACRADGAGLGRGADGLFDTLIVGPSMRDLITEGYLTEYRVFAATSDIDLSQVAISDTTGDFNVKQLRDAAQKSHIVGDVVAHYVKHAQGRLGITFATDVETAARLAQAYRDAGVAAEHVSAKTPDQMRTDIIRRFRRRELTQLVNVDLFGEGFDLPAIEVVSMARPTASYTLFCQQFGRGLRPMEGKSRAIILDHVGNVLRHGLPDAPREWSLDRRERKSKTPKEQGLIPATVCNDCTSLFEATKKICPYCGWVRTIAGRSSPQEVEGDLEELDLAALAMLRGQINQVDLELHAFREKLGNMPIAQRYGAMDQHKKRQAAQSTLREAIAFWAGAGRAKGLSDSEMYKTFYFRFGMDVLSAQALGRPDAEALTARVNADFNRMIGA